MKLHLPLFLRKSLLSCIALVAGYTLSSGTLAFADDLVLGAEDTLSIDYAAADSIPDLENGTLQLDGDTLLQLLNCGSGDGKTYTLATGVSGLVDAEGNPISLDSINNAISNYFDADRPGTGFWANGILQLSTDGTLQLVLHDQAVKEAVTITTRQTGNVNYQYYAGVLFKEISSSAISGAIYGGGDITLSNNGSVKFSGNTATGSSSDASGGAIYGNNGSTITLSGNGSVTFSGNTATGSSSDASGGAIYGYWYSTITLSNNGSVMFSGNTATGSSSDASGGAIYGYWYSTITLSNNGSVMFSGNTASSSSSDAYGGSIYGDDDSTITLSNNGSVMFSGNTASSSSSSDSSAYGGAIYGDYYSTITLSNNGSVVFEGNTASASSSYSSASGGAIYGDSSSTITLSDNGSVTFSGNTASASSSYSSASGGAIYGDSSSTITLSDNGSVTFSGNTASGRYADGGAIYTQVDLSIWNNDSVEFYQNAEVNGNTYRLRSIYAYGAYDGSGVEISLSAAAGKSITFRDSIYIGSYYRNSSFKLNEAYEGKAQLGDIIFTGATTVDDLYTVKNNVAGTTEEIRLSRTTEVNALTELYGGRLRVEDGAIYQGQGITAMEGSGATVRVQNATLSHSGYDLTFNAGTTLELVGNNIISGNLQMMEGSILSFDASDTTGVTCIDGDMSISGALTIANTDTWSGENTLLLWVAGMVTGSNDDYITVQGQNTLTWVGNDLVLNYNAATFDKYFNDEVTYTSSQQAGVYHHFERIEFENITSSSDGGAIYGFDLSTITLSNNESVTFSGNTATSSNSDAYGGAIYGGSSSTITLSNNESVVFSGNTASGRLVYGGAIYGDDLSTITLSNNESVVFDGNTASGSGAYGGAISGGTITLSNNGSVTFSGNTASGTVPVSGGAISGDTITLSNNGSVTFSGNTAVYGGAISGGTITLSNNESVTFSGNTAPGSSYASGGAIYAYGNLSIRNNDSVEFYQNAEVKSGVYRLRSIYAVGDVISLSAAAGKSITFRDSIYIDSGRTFKLNEAYEGMPQQGDIIFTGATTVDDLYAVKGNVAGTAEEIHNSRTSEVYTMTNLYGGRLRVEDGAVYKGNGITAMEGSAATVRVQNATLSHEGYDLEFSAGTTLEVAGESTIRGQVNLKEGSVFKLELGAVLGLHETAGTDAANLSVNGTALLSGTSTLNASLTLLDGSTLDMDNLAAGAVTLNGALTFGGQVTLGENLLALLDEKQGHEGSITLFTGLENVDWATVTGNAVSDCVWAGAVFSNMAGNYSYYLNYASDTGSLVIQIVPEPATATLSLLALTALAMRRRRK